MAQNFRNEKALPFLAGFCHGLIIPFTTFDLKNLTGKGQTFQGPGSPLWQSWGCQVGSLACQMWSPEAHRNRERGLRTVHCLLGLLPQRRGAVGGWEETPVGSEGGGCQGSHPSPSLVALFFFSLPVSKDGCLSLSFSLN